MTYRVAHEFDMAGWTYRPGQSFTVEELAARGAGETQIAWAMRRGVLEQQDGLAPAPPPEPPADFPAPEPDEG